VSCKSVQRVVETGNITVETYGSLQRYMDVFTQILNMSTSTKVMPSSVKGKEKEKEEDPLPTLADIE